MDGESSLQKKRTMGMGRRSERQKYDLINQVQMTRCEIWQKGKKQQHKRHGNKETENEGSEKIRLAKLGGSSKDYAG